MPRFPFAFALAIAIAAVAAGQPKPPPGKSGAKPADTVTKDGRTYKRHTLEGFIVHINEDVFAADTSKFERKPLDALDLELRHVTKMMTPKLLAVLRRLPVWVEWDDKPVRTTNGREHTALAEYRATGRLVRGRLVFEDGPIIIHSMRTLADIHQPGRDSGKCVMLHELAHAIHFQLVGFNSPSVEAAYRQAMDRSLYKKELYLTTTPLEYFAELTCAYFNQLDYYPRTRDELKKHDPVAFKLLDAVWGAAALKPNRLALAGAMKELADTGLGKFDLAVKLPDLVIGGPSGGPVAPEGMGGKVVLLGVWGRTDPIVLTRIAEAAGELEPFGAVAVIGVGNADDADRLTADVTARKADVTVVGRVGVPENGAKLPKFQPPLHAMVFEADGACAFRGPVQKILPHARAAVGRNLVAGLELENMPPGLEPAVKALTGGEPLLEAVPKFVVATTATEPITAAAATKLLAVLLDPGYEAVKAAQAQAETDPIAGFAAAETQQAKYKNTPVEAKAAALVMSLRQVPAVAMELKARPLLEQVRKFDAALSSWLGGSSPANPEFRRANATSLAQMKAVVEQMRKVYPKARATADAERLARAYGLN